MKNARYLQVFCTGLLFSLIVIGCTPIEYGSTEEYIASSNSKIDVVLPAGAPAISQQFRMLANREPKEGDLADHPGIDIIDKLGTPVIAPSDGRVIGSFFEPMYGNRIIIIHGPDQAGKPMTTVFKHLDKRMVAEGDLITRGQQIGVLGSTGALALQPHLHFEVHRKGKSERSVPVDPHLYWLKGIGKVTCFDSLRDISDSPFRTTYPVPCSGV